GDGRRRRVPVPGLGGGALDQRRRAGGRRRHPDAAGVLSVRSAARLIELLRLEPLPVEGGHFRQTWRPDAGTAIYYLLTDDPDSFSALHRLPTDEIYHF